MIIEEQIWVLRPLLFNLTRQFHSDVKKCRSFLIMLFASGELQR